MSVSAAPAIFDVFNARQLSPKDVARTFIAPPHFNNLVKPTHTLVVGPRGSGKTTLLKMLHPSALENWVSEEAAGFRDVITFSGVFIATDINWSTQVTALGAGKLDQETHQLFATAAFTTQVLQSLMETMHYRALSGDRGTVIAHRRVHLKPRDEAQMCVQVLDSWHLSKAIPSFEGVRIALAKRLSMIHQLASQEGVLGEDGREARLQQCKFLHLDFQYAAVVAVELFDSLAKESGSRWAFLFDEVELAPQWMRLRLIRLLRSTDERLIFKLSLSPYSADIAREMEEQEHGVGARQDFEPIRLWYVNKEHGYPFCRQLLNSILKQRKLPELEAEKLFGVSEFANDAIDSLESGGAYAPRSRTATKFKRLASIDPSFAHYLRRRDIDLEAMHLIPSEKRAADVRKARQIVSLRLYFRGIGKDLRKDMMATRRSRKVPTVYGGATSLFAMVEGNPRWFIGIVSQLLLERDERSLSSIRKAEQVRHVVEAAHIFRAMLRTLPCETETGSKKGLLSLLDPVGKYFANAAIDGDFDPDPPCSFKVDQATGDRQLRALGMALNAGAIVYAPEKGEVGVLRSLKGKRFRLSYILAPHYFFPLVLGRTVSLKSVLQSPSRALDVSDEPSLFGKGS